VRYGFIDGLGIKSWGKPFEIFGRNSLLSYFLAGLFYGIQEFINVRMADGSAGNLKLWICSHLFGSWLSPINASAAYAVTYVLLCLGAMTIVYRKGMFLKI
jgi:predicted acyltransferase